MKPIWPKWRYPDRKQPKKGITGTMAVKLGIPGAIAVKLGIPGAEAVKNNDTRSQGR